MSDSKEITSEEMNIFKSETVVLMEIYLDVFEIHKFDEDNFDIRINGLNVVSGSFSSTEEAKEHIDAFVKN